MRIEIDRWMGGRKEGLRVDGRWVDGIWAVK